MDRSMHTVKQTRSQRWLFGLAICTILTGSQFMQPATAMAARHIPQLALQKKVLHVPGISAETACLIDVDTGRVLYELHGDRKMRIASLTKIITAWIAVRSGKLSQVVTVSPNATRQEGSSIYLAQGEKQTLLALTYGLMLRSGNDAATAIAEFLGGSVPKFAQMMNHDVQRLGLVHSHFMNPHGLDDPMHFSTAHDMAVITATALKNPVFHQIVKTKYYSIPWANQPWERKMKNKNKLLWMMTTADGVKTGYTKKAGRCLASSATMHGHQVALVVLRDPSDWVDSANLLTYGLTAFDRSNLVQSTPLHLSASVRFGTLKSVPLVMRGQVFYPLLASEKSLVSVTPLAVKKLSAPVKVGQNAGKVQFRFAGRVIGQADLVTVQAVQAKGWFGRLREMLF